MVGNTVGIDDRVHTGDAHSEDLAEDPSLSIGAGESEKTKERGEDERHHYRLQQISSWEFR